MQVVDRLAPILAGIDDRAKAINQPLLGGDFADDNEQVPHQRGIRVIQVRNRGDLFLGDHQDMDRSLRTDIVKGQ